MALTKNQKIGIGIGVTVVVVVGIIIGIVLSRSKDTAKPATTPSATTKPSASATTKPSASASRICSKMGSCANSENCTCPSGTICDTTSLKCVCKESCDATCNCPNDTICSSGKCVMKPSDKEVYYYDKGGRYAFPQLTSGVDSVARNFANMKANKEIAESLGAVQASKEQIRAEWQGGLDSCNIGWAANNPDKDDTNVYIPYRTTRDKGSGCENPNVLSGDLPSVSGLQGTEKWGLWLYGKKPNLPECSGLVPQGQPCVGKYSPSKVSKYS